MKITIIALMFSLVLVSCNPPGPVGPPEELFRRAVELQDQKKDLEALPYFEAGLKAKSSGEMYFRYGNSMMNLKKYGEAVDAYQQALRYDYAKRHHALYNLACAHSLSGNTEEARANLESAIFRGYDAFGHLDKDPDLEAVRKATWWPAFRKRLERIRDRTRLPEEIPGNYRSAGGGEAKTIITLCPDGRLKEIETDVGICCRHSGTGTWIFDGRELVLHFNQTCRCSGVGPSEKGSGSCMQNFKNYKTDCNGKKVSRTFKIDEPSARFVAGDRPDCNILPFFCRLEFEPEDQAFCYAKN